MPILPRRVSKTGYSAARRDAGLDLGARQRHLAILADELAVGPDEHAGVVDQVPVALDESGDEVQPVVARELAEILGRRSGDRARPPARRSSRCL